MRLIIETMVFRYKSVRSHNSYKCGFDVANARRVKNLLYTGRIYGSSILPLMRFYFMSTGFDHQPCFRLSAAVQLYQVISHESMRAAIVWTFFDKYNNSCPYYKFEILSTEPKGSLHDVHLFGTVAS